jgi:hypothetical protein
MSFIQAAKASGFRKHHDLVRGRALQLSTICCVSNNLLIETQHVSTLWILMVDKSIPAVSLEMIHPWKSQR